MSIVILGIESSCDETAASICKNGKILSNIIASQEVHQKYGGVIPELASRAHLQNIIPVVHQAIQEANVSMKEISAIAVTKGPGLIGPLLVGTCFAKSMAMSMNIPIIEVNHIQAHVLAHFIDIPHPDFPFLCLTVSGGHTQIILVEDYLKMKIVGETLDDAAGEAFDKTAKILGLPYPGGPLIDKYAAKGNPDKYQFPEPNIPELNFSFSGLKTAILYFVREQVSINNKFIEENLHDICASVQKRIITILVNKLLKASAKYSINRIAISGGVSANSMFRQKLNVMGDEKKWEVNIPELEYCTDNAAMIAIAGHYKFLNQDFASQDLVPSARFTM